jgi:hypothetical protein
LKQHTPDSISSMHLIRFYMQAKECYHAVDFDDALEEHMAELRAKAAGKDEALLAKNELNTLRANAEALMIIRQWIHVSHRAKIAKGRMGITATYAKCHGSLFTAKMTENGALSFPSASLVL